MKICVVSNSTSKRTDYFIKAGRSLGADTCFVTYDELMATLPEYRDTVVEVLNLRCFRKRTSGNTIRFAGITGRC